jgi:hypothetical protein
MVAQKFGSSDPDVKAKGSKEKTDKPMLKASAKTPFTGKIGGPSNKFKRGGFVKRGR